jgi:hypothetical protein
MIATSPVKSKAVFGGTILELKILFGKEELRGQ